MSKVIVIPICYQSYRVDDEIFSVLGSTATMPPPIVLEMMVADGRARRLKSIHVLQMEGMEGHPDDDGDEEHHHHGLFTGEDDDDE